MSYLVLARKYRPRTFAEVCEQEVVVRTLQNAIQEDRVGHAYLLCGPRGTGKTTTARIFAKALNCERGPSPEPCGACDRCRASDLGAELDIVEIDAASNRGIDDVRVLRDEVAYAPLNARFKVYIVDEVHMMTGPAFNALLKTLEEPPAHVKFVFATTEVDQVPETIRSRCQILKLTLLREERIAARLAEVLAAEQIAAAPGVVDEVARLARGSLRDALSIADQLLALAGDAPTVEDVRRLAGAGGPERVEAVLGALEARDKAGVLAALAQADGSEGVLLDALLEHLRGALLALHCGERARLFPTEASELERRLARAKRLGSEKLELWLFELVGARARMDELATHARLVLELALLELCRLDAAIPLAELCERLVALEERLARGAAPSRAAPTTAPGAATAPERARLPAAPAPAQPAAPELAPRELRPAPPRPSPAPGRAVPPTGAAAWSFVLAELEAGEPELARALARSAKLVDVGASTARIVFSKLREDERERLLGDATREACAAPLSRVYGRELRVVLEDATARPPGERDAFTRAVAELFDGHIEDGA